MLDILSKSSIEPYIGKFFENIKSFNYMSKQIVGFNGSNEEVSLVNGVATDKNVEDWVQ
jgi:hypothetical protein